jgi:SSS family solute:Na+ symporter
MKHELVKLSHGDLLVLLAFFGTIVWIGAKFVRTKGKILDFLLGGRALTLPVFVLTLFSTWYGGILGVGEFGFSYGISSWILQGVPYYIFAAIFAVVFAKRARRAEVVTIPEQLEKIYGKKVSYLGAIFTGVLSCPAPYVLMFAILLQIITGWTLFPCLLVGTLFSFFYLWFGGFKADVATDVFFGIVMIFGFMVILPFLYMKYGGVDFLVQNLPDLHLKWHGGNSAQFIIMWFFIALWTFIEPTFYQRCYAAQDEKVAEQGIFISIGFWFLFDIMTVIAALYSKAIFHNLDQPMMAYPLLADLVLPSVWKGIFFAGMFATILSTLNSQLFVSATSLGRDLCWKVTGDSEKTEIRWIRMGMIVAALLCLWMAYRMPSVVRLWYTIGTVIVPGLLVAMVSTFFKKMYIPSNWMLATMVTGFSVSLIWLCLGWKSHLGASDYPLGIEPMFPGLFASLLIWGVARVFFTDSTKPSNQV